jgi:hypothetical protein
LAGHAADAPAEASHIDRSHLFGLRLGIGSKEALVGAYLESRHRGTLERLKAAVGRHRDPRKRLLAVFEAQGELITEPGFRGCAIVTATAEAPYGSLIDKAVDDYRAEMLALLTDLARDAGVTNPARLGRQLHLVFDGAGIAARMDHDASVARSARAAAEALLDTSL